MSRLAAALAALVLVPLAAHAQAEKKAEELDPKTKAAIDRAVEHAKEDIRNEVRQELQGAQAAAEFMGAVAEGPKLQFLELAGYFRVRAQLLDRLDLGVGRDRSGRYLFPVPFDQPDGTAGRSTMTTANMRLRLEPTLNVSERVRVRAQIDVLDNHVLGSSTSSLYDDPGAPYPATFYGSSRVVGNPADPRLDAPYVSPKRVWAEVQTPVGLLSFGRMPSEWGLGIMANAGAGIDEDFGDTVDRIQFALPSVATPTGRVVLVPFVDFDSSGVLYRQPYAAPGTGQPFNAESGDDGRTYGFKLARFDTPEEVRRKVDRGGSSVNFGAYYNYRTQHVFYPEWNTAGFDASYANTTGPVSTVRRSAYAHVLDLWFRWLSPRWRVEAEVAGVYGAVGDPRSDPSQPGPTAIELRQWGGALVVDYKVAPNKVLLGGEIGAASGDDAPGFGNVPSYGPQPYGSKEGAQWCMPSATTACAPDRSIRNFRFNPAYRVDLVLFHQILGQVTDAMYLKSRVRWDILPGLGLDAALMYAFALETRSTPSVRPDGSGGSSSLGVELDSQLTYTAGDGFMLWGQAGVLWPLGGLEVEGRNPSRGWVLASGLAVKF
jgi:uncharacterized protein (TIGR04551 family)